MAVYAMTGGATGIGAAIKQRLRGEGHRVIVVDIKEADIEADLASAAGRRQAIEAIRAAADEGLDGLVTCAGLGSQVSNHPLIARVNYFGTTELIEGLRDRLEARRGAAVLISSNSAPHPSDESYLNALLDGNEAEACRIAETLDGHQCYSGSKQAVVRWMRRNTPAYAAAGVRLNAVAPGYTQTPMTREVENDPNYGPKIKAFMDSIPMRRPGKPEDMAAAVCFLLQPESSFICGALLYVDGGHDALLRPDQI